jgi:hypothetical protein
MSAHKAVPASKHPDDVGMTIERDGVDIEVEAFIDDGYVTHAFVACERPKREVSLTREEEERAVAIWVDRQELKRDTHDADAFDRAGDR